MFELNSSCPWTRQNVRSIEKWLTRWREWVPAVVLVQYRLFWGEGPSCRLDAVDCELSILLRSKGPSHSFGWRLDVVDNEPNIFLVSKEPSTPLGWRLGYLHVFLVLIGIISTSSYTLWYPCHLGQVHLRCVLSQIPNDTRAVLLQQVVRQLSIMNCLATTLVDQIANVGGSILCDS